MFLKLAMTSGVFLWLPIVLCNAIHLLNLDHNETTSADGFIAIAPRFCCLGSRRRTVEITGRRETNSASRKTRPVFPVHFLVRHHLFERNAKLTKTLRAGIIEEPSNGSENYQPRSIRR